MRRITLLVLALALLAVPGVSQAKAPKPPKGKCLPHAVSYRVSGKLVSGTLTPGTGKNIYSGTLVVQVTKTNKHAKADKGTTQTYTLTNAKLKLHGEDPAALTPDSRVKLKGTITTLAKKCDQTGFTATVTIKSGSIKPPKSHA
jgi:hypothetical protein